MSAAHRRFLWLEQGVVPTLFNFFLNAGIAWLLFRSLAVVPLWGPSSIAGDTLATAFLLPFLTTLIVSRAVAGQVRAGRVAPVSARPAPLPLGPLAAHSPLRRGALLGLAAMVAAAAPVIAWLSLAGPHELAFSSFLWFKATFAALLAALVTPWIGWVALVRCSAAGPAHPSRA